MERFLSPRTLDMLLDWLSTVLIVAMFCAGLCLLALG